jgi:hypothetical protein
MRRGLCPFCYHKIDRRRLWFLCLGNPGPGRARCTKEKNPKRQQETGHEEEMYPVFPPRAPWLPGALRRVLPRRMRCPHCRGETGRQVCPYCNTPLPSEFSDSFSPVIAMAGAASTGKTVYLTVLADQILNVIRPRFDADSHPIGDEGNRWLERNRDLILNRQLLPPITQRRPDGRSEPLLIKWRLRSFRFPRRYRSSYLSFLDVAGESLGTESGVRDLRFLARVHAFIILLDPFAISGLPERIGLPNEARSPTEALTVVQQVTEVLRTERAVRGMIRLPVAVVFAKADALRRGPGEEQLIDEAIFAPESDMGIYDDEAARSMHVSVREMLHDLNADAITQVFEKNYTDYRYFAVSSLGRPPNYEDGKSAGAVRPIRVSEPLVWLLAKYDLVPKGKADG